MSLDGDQPSLAIDPEEQARANFYALLARLFSAPPDDQILRGIGSSDDGDAHQSDVGDEARGGRVETGSIKALSLDAAWGDLVNAAASTDQATVAEEYDQLFVGSGRAEVSLYVGAYTARSSVDTKLVALREFLASHGIQRQSAVHEPEDHIAMLFEVMRYLICEGETSIEEQSSFFDRFVWSGGISLCDAISSNEDSKFFVSVAAFAKSFLVVEHDAFEM